MKTSVRANRHIASGDLTENEKYWNDRDRFLRRERVHVAPVIVYSVTAYSGASKTGAWASIIEWPQQVELVHGATSISPDDLRLIAAFRTLSCIREGRPITYYSDFAGLVGKLKEYRGTSSHVGKSNGWPLLHDVVEKRTVEWRFDINKRPQIASCREIVASDLKCLWALRYGH